MMNCYNKTVKPEKCKATLDSRFFCMLSVHLSIVNVIIVHLSIVKGVGFGCDHCCKSFYNWIPPDLAFTDLTVTYCPYRIADSWFIN